MKTKQLTFLLALTFLFLFLTGCSIEGFIDDLRFKGTSVGITNCIERNKQEGVPSDLIKSTCINENQKKLKKSDYYGYSGYHSISNSRHIDRKNKDYDRYCVDGKNSLNQEIRRFTFGKELRELDNCTVIHFTEKSTYTGAIENKSDDKIITSFEIHVSHDDNIDSNGKKITEIFLFKVWVLPNKSISVKEKKLVFHPKRDRIFKKKGDRIFSRSSFQNVKGVDFILK